ncbi:MAG: DEAD/DEAH box helicase [Gemmatimonadota bacterium]
MRAIRDQYLPPDHDAFVRSEPPTGRVIVVAPTRAACETIELAFTLDLETFLLRTKRDQLLRLARSGRGFGIVAGTGTGKTLAVKPIAEQILRTRDLRVGVVNREREATPETPTWNVIIVTTGIARRWFQDGDIQPRDTLVVDEIHQTSAELELVLALGKRTGVRFVWLSATVDPTFYARYLGTPDVLEVSAFDPAKAATVEIRNVPPVEFMSDRFLRGVRQERRGVAVFLPTRAATEQVAAAIGDRWPGITTAHYHGGEPIRVIRPFLEGEVPKPFVLAMTAAGQSAITVPGLDTVIIDDSRFANVIQRGRNVLTRVHLGANELLQMAGRVHGRVEGGRVFILSDRDLHFASLRPEVPEFQLAGDSERVALTCADLGVRADDLELPVALDRTAYRQAVARLESRGIIEHGRLTGYGRDVEKLPVERPWAELLVHADDALVPYVSVMASIESLHRMTREDRNLEGLVVPGSDHLTAYNVYAAAFRRCGHIGEVYGLPRQLFREGIADWAERTGVLVKALEDAALAMASVYRALSLPLPTEMPPATDRVLDAWRELVARYMPFDLVVEEETADGQHARVSKTSVCGSWGAVAGTLRYFADRQGIPRASIEGTQLPVDRLRAHATRHPPRPAYDPRRRHDPLVLESRVEYHGFELERETETLDRFPPGREDEVRRVLADALARGVAHHPAPARNAAVIEQVRELWRRSGGDTARLGLAELTDEYARRLADVRDMRGFRATALRMHLGEFVAGPQREALEALPGAVTVRDREVPLDYDVDDGPDGPVGVVRLRLPEKLARTLTEAELPALDRPVRFTVLRGQRGAVRADTLAALQDALDAPWSPDEVRPPPERDERQSRDEREVRRLARQFQGRGRGPQGRGGGRPGGGHGRDDVRDGHRGRGGRPGGGRRGR